MFSNVGSLHPVMKTVRMAAAKTAEYRDDIDAALVCVNDVARQAEAGGARLLCFPEGFLQGYLIDAEAARRIALDLSSPVFSAVLERFPKSGPTIALGLIETEGGRLFNTAVVIERGRLVGRYRRRHLLGGERAFEAGTDPAVFDVDGLRSASISVTTPIFPTWRAKWPISAPR